MAGNPEAVLKLVHEVIRSAKPIAIEEMKEVRQFALTLDGIKDLQSWDVAFYSKKILQKKHDIDTDELRAYFPVSKVVSGLFELLNKLYGISIHPNEKAPKWDPLVECFDVLDENEVLRGTFYMDLYSRAGKSTGPGYAFSLRQRREFADGTIQHPIAVVSCNLNPPTEKQPALISPEEVQVNLFHEVGHCLQLVLTQVNGVLSTFENLLWDAVELPSHFLEYWAKEKDVYPLISAHYETNKPLPQMLINKLKEARNFQSGLDWVNYLENVLFDLSLHMQYDPDKPSQIQTIMNQVRQQVSVLPKPECNRFQNHFTHAFAG
jgi:oligopeptidase A